MDSILSYTSKSDIGTRDEQQDYTVCCYEQNVFIAVVCDGMGGLDDGFIASKSAAETLVELIKSRDKTENISNLFLRSVDILDEKVSNLKNELGQKLKAGTTLVSVLIEENQLYWLSVGDSRLYLMRQNELVQATRDHNYSLVLNSMPQNYVPTENELAKKDALISYIGMGGIEIMDINNNPISLMKNDMILLTSDGLFKALSDDQIKTILAKNNNTEETAQELLLAAEKNAPDSRDNITFVFIKIKGA